MPEKKMFYLRTWLLFVKVIFCYAFTIKRNGKYYLAGKTLFSLSFRYSEKDKNSFLFFFKSYLKSLLTKRKPDQSRPAIRSVAKCHAPRFIRHDHRSSWIVDYCLRFEDKTDIRYSTWDSRYVVAQDMRMCS